MPLGNGALRDVSPRGAHPSAAYTSSNTLLVSSGVWVGPLPPQDTRAVRRAARTELSAPQYTGIDKVQGGEAGGGQSRGEHLAQVLVESDMRSSVDSDGSVTVMVEDSATDDVTVYQKKVLIVDISSSEEEEEGWLVSPSLHSKIDEEAEAPRTPEKQPPPPGLTSVSSWPSLLSWGGTPAPGMTMPPRVAWHHKGAAAVA